MNEKKRIIFHLDMDHFYTAVEERENQALKGKPVVVGADPKAGKGRGVVSTSNYEARAAGIRSGMPISQAFRLPKRYLFTAKFSPLHQSFSRNNGNNPQMRRQV
jgi:nucleotidyltransferase/DNA polymerase involved in DNA repair